MHLFPFAAFLFQPQAFWSAVEVYDPLLLMLVDFLWTSLPGIIHGYSDQDLPTHLLPSVPVLYTPVRASSELPVLVGFSVCRQGVRSWTTWYQCWRNSNPIDVQAPSQHELP